MSAPCPLVVIRECAGHLRDSGMPIVSADLREARAAVAELVAVLDEILDYSGGAESALDDEYVMEHAKAVRAKFGGAA